MKIFDVEQGSAEWHKCRLGIPTASEFDSIITPLGAESKQIDQYADAKLAEVQSGEVAEEFEGTDWMKRGKELEIKAVQWYELQRNLDTKVVGFVTDDAGTMGCSPDRLVGDDGLLEIKIPKPKTMIQYQLKQNIDTKYRPQLQGQLFVTGRKWVDIVCYHPTMTSLIIRVERDEQYLFLLTRYLAKFHANFNEKHQTLIKNGYMKEIKNG